MHKILLPTMLLSLGICLSQACFAIGERMFESIMRTDFIFDSDLTNTPFIPVSWLSYSRQQALTFDTDCQFQLACQFDYEQFSQGLGLPVYVGKKDMFIVGETLDVDRLDFGENQLRVNTLGVLAAWIAQPSPKWQLGAAIYSYRGFDNAPQITNKTKHIAGFGGRYRHSPRLHSYYALVYYQGFEDELVFPYIGFDWFINKRWTLSGVLPWPSVNYAPDLDSVYRFGMLQAGSSFQFQRDGDVFSSQFNQWQIGVSAERRLYKKVWGQLSVGYSGFGNLAFNNSGETTFDIDIDDQPFFRLTLNFRP